jgi:hypothetical protein
LNYYGNELQGDFYDDKKSDYRLIEKSGGEFYPSLMV